MSKIEQSVIKQARQTDLPAFLVSQGEPLKRRGKRYQHRDHDSLWMSGNMFYWNSKQEKGNSLDFVMLYYEWDFKRAIRELTGFDRPKENPAGQGGLEGDKPFGYIPAPDCKRAIAYLCKTRKIEYPLVKKLIESHHIAQDEKGNVVFKIYDELGELIGAELVGTLTQYRFKGMAANTKAGYGFNVTKGKPEKNLFFEAPIDLLSFWSMNKNKIMAHRLISLAGLRKDILLNAIQTFKMAPQSVYICVDNDLAAQAFIKQAQGEIKGVKTYLPPTPCKDWNDVLQNQK